MLANQTIRLVEDPSPGRVDARSAVRRRTVEGVLVLRPQGALDGSSIEAVVELLSDAGGPVIIDLDDCIVVDPGVTDRVASYNEPASSVAVCAVCRRLSARRLLARSGALRDVAVFQSVEDAAQAWLLAREGYGPGWARP